MPKTIRTTTVERKDDDEDEESAELSNVPLLDRDATETKSVDRIAVRRLEPEEGKGHLGYLPPTADVADIEQRWGGGTFRLDAKTAAGQIVPKGCKNITIAGDPIFTSEIAEARWRRNNGLGPKRASSSPGDGLSVKEALLMIEEGNAKRREETAERERVWRQEALDREERMRREQREHEERLAKDAAEREERRRKDEAEREERRRREQREDDERRARQHREDLERMQAGQAAQLAQTQQFFQQLAAMKKDGGGGDGTKQLLMGMEIMQRIAGEKGGDGEPNVVQTIFERLPDALREARQTATQVISEVRGGGKNKAGQAEVTITGPTAEKVQTLIKHLTAQGKDPERVLDQVASYLLTTTGAAAAPKKIAGKANASKAPPPKASRPAPAPAPARAAARRPPVKAKSSAKRARPRRFVVAKQKSAAPAQ